MACGVEVLQRSENGHSLIDQQQSMACGVEVLQRSDNGHSLIDQQRCMEVIQIE